MHFLKDPAAYYGEEGKKFLSYSSIGTLLKDPQSFGKDKPKTSQMVFGSYLHTLVLEPEKISEFQIVDASTRTTKIYKELAGDDVLLLQSEADEAKALADKLLTNFEFYSRIFADGNEYEMPGITELFDLPWKGRADIVTPDMVYDIKTTANLDEFKWSARKYNYDAQAWIYNQIFQRPMEFLVVEKGTGRLGIFTCSDTFLEYGKEKVIEACKVYNRFFGPEATEDIESFFKTEEL